MLIYEADLDAVLRGEPAPNRAVLNSHAAPEHLGSPKSKGGRPPNPAVDQFWIEICRIVAEGLLPREQAAYTKRMAQWATAEKKCDYSEETVRKTVSKRLAALRWRQAPRRSRNLWD